MPSSGFATFRCSSAAPRCWMDWISTSSAAKSRGLVGPSGAGKSVLTRTIIGLVPKTSGSIEVFGVDLDAADARARRGVERRWGILFQQGALFSSLSVRQNIQFPVREYLNVS